MQHFTQRINTVRSRYLRGYHFDNMGQFSFTEIIRFILRQNWNRQNREKLKFHRKILCVFVLVYVTDEEYFKHLVFILENILNTQEKSLEWILEIKKSEKST